MDASLSYLEMLPIIEAHPMDLSSVTEECIGNCPIMTMQCNLVNNRIPDLEAPTERSFFIRSTDDEFEWLFFSCQAHRNEKVHVIRCSRINGEYLHDLIDWNIPMPRRRIPPAASQQKDHFFDEDLDCGN